MSPNKLISKSDNEETMRTINWQEISKNYLLQEADRRTLTKEGKLKKPCLKYIQGGDIFQWPKKKKNHQEYITLLNGFNCNMSLDWSNLIKYYGPHLTQKFGLESHFFIV